MEKNIGYSHLLCGLSGSGKTTLGKIVADILNLEFIDFADLIVKKAQLLEHDEILKLPPEILVNVVDEGREELSIKVNEGKKYIIETHLGILVEGIGYRLTHPEILKKRNTLSIIVVIPRYKDLSQWKNIRDAERDQIVLTKEQYENDKQILLIDASISAAMLKIPLFVEKNPANSLKTNANRVAQIIETASKIKGF